MSWLFALIVLLMAQKEFMANPTPLKLPGYTHKLTPYIKHWEAANYNREELHQAHLKHIEQARTRRKRELDGNREHGLAHTIRLNFSAHDRDFRLILRQNPTSVFSNDVEIESTHGPVDYDVTRVYTGTLEGDDSAHVHAILTSDNLLDGTIETAAEQYYVEPAHRYSSKLAETGVHSIVYKVSDVNMRRRNAGAVGVSKAAETSAHTHCASERLRRKRWLPDELSSADTADSRNPPLPLDLEVPYNDDFRVLANHEQVKVDKSKTTTTPPRISERNTESLLATLAKAPQNQNILVNNYTPSSTSNSSSSGSGSGNSADSSRSYNGNSQSSPNSNQNLRKYYTKHKNIIVSTYNRPGSDSEYAFDDIRTTSFANATSTHNLPNNFFNANWTTMFMVPNDRPSHKTHVEIITKNGATRKPNIIINNYNPEITFAPNPHNPSFNSMLMTNLLSGRGQDGNDINSSPRLLYDRKTTCMLYLQADHTFFQKMGSDEASIEAITRHVQRANSIYKNTDFNNDGKPDNITFMIKRIKVHNMQATKDPGYRFPGNYGVEKFLELFSEEDYDAFCLAYMFTYRDFEMGTLGLAWTGDLKNAGGVCEKNGHYRGSLKSLNTGIVTLLNYGKHVPPAVSHVTLAHEIGHNFGSPHDPEQCTPGGEDGNFIMFARATSGDKKNNNKFSACSLRSIEPVLNAKARSAKGCFTEPQSSICGNGVVEPGEECDCGWEEDCKDTCCFPMSRQQRIDEKPCTLTPHARCSPSQGPCCTGDCKLKFGDKCRDDNGCRDPSFCDGRVPQCPPSVNKPNKTICNKEFVCYMGDCTGSICLAYGLESCQCIPGPNDDRIKSCELCCKLPGEGSPCRSSFEWNDAPFDVPDMYSKPGTPCNDYNGYCDVFQKCREVDPSGPLATLRKLLLSEESIATFKKWMQSNWYTVALAALGVFVLLILSTKLLAKRSNLKLKSVTIIHSATTETVRLPDNNNGVIVHTAVRTKVPFKKKVRGERSSNKAAGKAKTKGNKVTTSGSRATAAAAAIVNGNGATIKATANSNSVSDPKKPARSKKKLVTPNSLHANATGNAAAVAAALDDGQHEKAANDLKKSKKLGKQIKEIIDYSHRNAADDAESTLSPHNHTNTFGKVQKWLLESPIVAQPLSHIEHASKVRKVMSKSQSTPERLVQKTPQKTKSMGNLSNEKVKLQVVYKPPFKFSLRLSKKSKVKTHVVSGAAGGISAAAAAAAAGRTKRAGKASTRGNIGHHQLGKDIKSLYTDRAKRSALLLCNDNEEDNQILTLNEPNYETLKPPRAGASSTAVAANAEQNYENVDKTKAGDVQKHVKPNSSSSGGSGTGSHTKVAPSTSKAGQERQSTSGLASGSYFRSNSLTSNNPFAVAPKRSTSKLKEAPNGGGSSASGSINLHRNFGSTQNLLNLSQNLAKSKKRSSLNLKTNVTKNGKDPPIGAHRRSSSNMNLRRDSSGTSLGTNAVGAHAYPHAAQLQRNISANVPPQPAPRGTARSSFSNIPRASLNLSATLVAANAANFARQLSAQSAASSSSAASSAAVAAAAAKATMPPKSSHSAANLLQQSASATAVFGAQQRRTAQPMRRSLHNFQHSNNATATTNARPSPHIPHTHAPAAADNELPSDLEVVVSDIENLVS